MQSQRVCFFPTFLTWLLVLGKYWGCMQRLASCPDSWVPRGPGADAEVEAVTALASLSVGILAEDR
jgi:histone deacetylase 7